LAAPKANIALAIEHPLGTGYRVKERDALRQ
jgi:hypothetical protein